MSLARESTRGRPHSAATLLAGRRERAADTVLGAALLATGLNAGPFYAFDVGVMAGLQEADDRTFVEAMQQINRAIENPVFLASFLGAPVLTAVAVVQQRRLGSRAAATTRWVVGALGLSAAVFAVTVGANVPLNDELTRAGDPDRIADLAAVRERFEDPWAAWNIVRTVASTAALLCLGRALVLHGRSSPAGAMSPDADSRA